LRPNRRIHFRHFLSKDVKNELVERDIVKIKNYKVFLCCCWLKIFFFEVGNIKKRDTVFWEIRNKETLTSNIVWESFKQYIFSSNGDLKAYDDLSLWKKLLRRKINVWRFRVCFSKESRGQSLSKLKKRRHVWLPHNEDSSLSRLFYICSLHSCLDNLLQISWKCQFLLNLVKNEKAKNMSY